MTNIAATRWTTQAGQFFEGRLEKIRSAKMRHLFSKHSSKEKLLLDGYFG